MRAYGAEFERSAILAEFQDRGVSRSTAFGWMAKVVQGGDIIGKEVDKAATVGQVKPGKKGGEKATKAAPAPIAVAGVAAKLPPLPKLSDVSKIGLLPVVDLLQKCIDAAEKLSAYAHLPDGKVRNARLILQASEHLRKSVETAARLNESVAVYAEMEAFHDAVIAEISEESRDVAERILRRLGKLCDQTLVA
jgi:hypothetical protein